MAGVLLPIAAHAQSYPISGGQKIVFISAGSQQDENLSDISQAAATARAWQIKAELAQLKTHEWAGEYYEGDGEGENISLLTAPKAGFVFRWQGCLGLYGLNYGSVEATSGRLKLLFEHPNQRGIGGFEPELTPVVWGDRHYLIPPGEMHQFASDVNGGLEPRKEIYGLYLLRRGDERKKVRGAPTIPAEYRGYLLAAPIRARVSSVGESRPDKRYECLSKGRVTPVILDVGSGKGVKVGMEFYLYSPLKTYATIKVTKVEDGASEGEVFQCIEDAPPSTGWKFSTRLGGGK